MTTRAEALGDREGYVVISPVKAQGIGIGLCLRVSCLTPMGHRTGEIPIQWWQERTRYYESFGLNAVEVCFLALEDWEQVTAKLQEN